MIGVGFAPIFAMMSVVRMSIGVESADGWRGTLS
jgi:hypothetical protein